MTKRIMMTKKFRTAEMTDNLIRDGKPVFRGKSFMSAISKAIMRLLLILILHTGLTICCALCPEAGGARLQAQDIPGVGSIAGLVSRAIKAIDLKIQRLQNKTIALQNAQQLIENAMSKLHLQDIATWASRQKELYGKYFEELRKVKTVLTTYWKVKEVMQRQLLLVSEYKTAWSRLKNDDHFSAGELSEMYRIYSGILEESLRNLDQLLIACDQFSMQISDGKRLALIAEAAKLIEKNLGDLRRFNRRNYNLSLSRAWGLADALLTRRLYGLE